MNGCRPRHVDLRVDFCVMVLLGIVLMSHHAVEGSESSSQMGNLKIEGEHIESLTLSRNGGGTIDVARPDETVVLEPGTYTLESVQLRGGYYTPTVSPVPVTIEVRTGKTAVLKAGAPLIEAVLKAFPHLNLNDSCHLYVFTGPYMSAEDFTRFHRCSNERIRISRFTTDFLSYLAAADLSVSMGGYNTCMNLLTSGVTALVWPFSYDREQGLRARRLARRGGAA